MNLGVFNHYRTSENQKTPEANPWLLVPPPSQNGGSFRWVLKIMLQRLMVWRVCVYVNVCLWNDLVLKRLGGKRYEAPVKKQSIQKWLSGTRDMIWHNVKHRSQKSLAECHISVRRSFSDWLLVCVKLDEHDLSFLVAVLYSYRSTLCFIC